MANNPSFSFYVNDFEGGTRHMTDAELGCYMRLMLAQFNREGILPNDPKFLRRFCTTFDESWPIVKEKFREISPGKIQNKRLEKERVKRKNFVESRVKNKIGKSTTYEEHMTQNEKTYEEHMGYGYGKGNGEGNKGMVMVYNAETEILANQIEFERICMAAGKPIEKAKESLRKYHLFLEENEKYPKSKKALFAGFEKWLINEKNFTNGSISKSIGKPTPQIVPQGGFGKL